ncbi:MAG: hypothetical protein ABSG41_29455 [Bryobacteraceae bacterium]|jgi:hypothetical protein
MSAPRGRPFAPGNTLGRGRPKGSSNKVKSPEQELLDEYKLPLTRKCISLAGQGDRSAMRICMDRIFPPRRDACIRMSLPPIKTARDVDKAAERVTQAIGRGKIAPAEGAIMMEILKTRSEIIESVHTVSRIEKLEKNMAADMQPRREDIGK